MNGEPIHLRATTTFEYKIVHLQGWHMCLKHVVFECGFVKILWGLCVVRCCEYGVLDILLFLGFDAGALLIVEISHTYD